MTLRQRMVAIINSFDKEKSWQTFSEQEIKDQLKDLSVKDRSSIYRALNEAAAMVRVEVKCDHPESEIRYFWEGMGKECQVCKMNSYTETKYKPGLGSKDNRIWSEWK